MVARVGRPIFARQGFPTYVVDFPTRGRAAFNPIPVHQARYEQNWSKLPTFSRSGAETLWTAFRFGPSNGVKHARMSFPTEVNRRSSRPGLQQH